MLDFYVKRRTRFSLRDKGIFEIIEVEITRVDCICIWQWLLYMCLPSKILRNKSSSFHHPRLSLYDALTKNLIIQKHVRVLFIGQENMNCLKQRVFREVPKL